MAQPEGFKLFIGGLPGDITNEDLYAVFPTYGEVLGVYILPNSSEKSKTGNCCAFVTYKTKEAAEDAITVLDGKYKIRDGPEVEPIKVSWPRDKNDKGPGKGKGDGFKGDGFKGEGYKGGYDAGYNGGPKGDSKGYKGDGKGKGGGYGAPAYSNGYDAGAYDRGGAGYQGGGCGYGGGGCGWQQKGAGWQDQGNWGGCGCGYGGGKGGYGKGGSDYAKGGDQWKGGGGGGGGNGGGGGGGQAKLFVGNLPNDIQEEALRYVFSAYGKVEKVFIMAGRAKSGQSCAFVEYGNFAEAETAIATLSDKYEIKPGEGPILVKYSNSSGKDGGKGPRMQPY